MNLVKVVMVFTLVSLATVSNLAFSEDYVEGKDYIVLSKPGIPSSPGKIEVREFFWYGCPHCYNLEAKVSPWKKALPNDVEFVMTPAVSAPHWKVLGSAYYAAEGLGISEKSHEDVFKAIHRDKRSLNTVGQVAKFYSQYGVTKQQVEDQMESFSVKTALRKSESLFRQYKLASVPVIIVHGKYQPISKSYDQLLKITEFLIEKERKAMLARK